MPNQDASEQGAKWDQRERAVLYLLTEDGSPPVWSVADIGREIDYFDAEAVLLPLVRAGLLHRIADEFVVAAPAAYKWVALVGEII